MHLYMHVGMCVYVYAGLCTFTHMCKHVIPNAMTSMLSLSSLFCAPAMHVQTLSVPSPAPHTQLELHSLLGWLQNKAYTLWKMLRFGFLGSFHVGEKMSL